VNDATTHNAHHHEDNHRKPIQDPQKPYTDTARDKQKTESRIIEYDNLAAHTVSWTPDDKRVTLETCRVLPSNKEHKKLHLVGNYMIIYMIRKEKFSSKAHHWEYFIFPFGVISVLSTK